MLNDRESFTVRDDELSSVEEEYELLEWARAAGVSAEDLRRALQHNATWLAAEPRRDLDEIRG